LTKPGQMTITPISITPSLDPQLFDPYLSDLKQLFSATRPAADVARSAAFVAALDGQPSRELRKLYSLHDLRQTGTYFTGSDLTAKVIAPVVAEISSFERIIDPSCGAGDLLVGAARHLPLLPTLSQTLKLWGKRLTGFDINSSFVATTRVRLALLAMQRLNLGSGTTASTDIELYFPNIRLQSGLDDWEVPAGRHLILSNPPFSHTQSPLKCEWANGRVSCAAVFVTKCLAQADHGSRLIAILPDVLRTGSRYVRWRKQVEECSNAMSVEILGRFDKQTDIDVFVLDATCSQSAGMASTWCMPTPVESTIGDLFEVHVGPVVGFRLNGQGPWHTFLHSSELPIDGKASDFATSIRFQGKTYEPPFVAVRRTSKAEYKTRCLATLVTGRSPLAVDDHLLIVSPKDGKVSTCKRLLKVLADAQTTTWMNARIRCRHLTVSALRDVPWIGGPEDEQSQL
jgi:hypothetical protein